MNTALPEDPFYWQPEDLLEIELPDPDAFLKIRETLTRIGIASKKEKTLFQSAIILHKRGKYFICHFKEMFLLSGRDSDITNEDIWRRNTIATLLQQWGLCKLISPAKMTIPVAALTIVPHKDKSNWKFVQKYTLSSDRKRNS